VMVYPIDGATAVRSDIGIIVVSSGPQTLFLAPSAGTTIATTGMVAVPSPLPSPSLTLPTPAPGSGMQLPPVAYSVPTLAPHTTYTVETEASSGGVCPPPSLGAFTTS
jgi:hypothetical protein